MASLSHVVSHYIRHHRTRARAELDWFRSQPTLEAAISEAALARDARGKRLSHQARIARVTLDAARLRLLALRDNLAAADTFQDLHDHVRSALSNVRGLGELYFYDTTLRIGARLGLAPKSVFLHRGARIGARALGLPSHVSSLDVHTLPAQLQVLAPHEIEDVLCIYKSRFTSAAV